MNSMKQRLEFWGEVEVVIKDVRFEFDKAYVWLCDVGGLGVAMILLCCLGASLGGCMHSLGVCLLLRSGMEVICIFAIFFGCVWLFKCC